MDNMNAGQSTELKSTQPAILIVSQHFWPETFRINEIAASLVARGYLVDVLCGIPNYPKGHFYPGYSYSGPRFEIHDGIRIYRAGEIPQYRWLGSVSISANFLFFPLAGLFNLPRLIGRRYDSVLIFATSPIFMAFPGILAAKFKRIPSFLYVLDYWPDSLYTVIPLKSRLLRKILHATSMWHYRQASRILTPSLGMKNKIVTEAGIAATRIDFLAQSCEPFYERLDHDPSLHERFDGSFNLVFAGNIGPAQALDVLVLAVTQIQKSGSHPPFRVVLVGDGMSRLLLQDQIRQAGLEDYFVFEGHKPAQRIPAYHELADALLVTLAPNPLFSLMIPGKVQSYCAAGKPILAVLEGEGSQIIREAEAGLVSEPGKPEQLAENLLKMITMAPEQRRKMGQNGRMIYDLQFQHDTVMDKLEDILRKESSR
jgi:glycosyltransferase involved in cell wall biosynthesis